jgi:hypothetical protein
VLVAKAWARMRMRTCVVVCFVCMSGRLMHAPPCEPPPALHAERHASARPPPAPFERRVYPSLQGSVQSGSSARPWQRAAASMEGAGGW